MADEATEDGEAAETAQSKASGSSAIASSPEPTPDGDGAEGETHSAYDAAGRPDGGGGDETPGAIRKRDSWTLWGSDRQLVTCALYVVVDYPPTLHEIIR